MVEVTEITEKTENNELNRCKCRVVIDNARMQQRTQLWSSYQMLSRIEDRPLDKQIRRAEL